MIRAFTLAAAAVALLAGPALADETPDPIKVAIHVDENNPQKMNMALNNAQNIDAHYEAQGQDVQIEIVAYGPGLHMLRADTSPVADRIAALSLELDAISFSGCGNTHAIMSRRAGAPVELLPEAELTPSGAVRLIELQRQGYAYLRP